MAWAFAPESVAQTRRAGSARMPSSRLPCIFASDAKMQGSLDDGIRAVPARRVCATDSGANAHAISNSDAFVSALHRAAVLSGARAARFPGQRQFEAERQDQ